MSDPTPEPTPDSRTLVEVEAELRDAGWTGQFRVGEGGLVCGECGVTSDPADIVVDATHRFEGMTNPGDESILFAITAPCGHQGSLVAAFGPTASRDEIAVLQQLPRPG